MNKMCTSNNCDVRDSSEFPIVILFPGTRKKYKKQEAHNDNIIYKNVIIRNHSNPFEKQTPLTL